jgi:hypothetical protein
VGHWAAAWRGSGMACMWSKSLAGLRGGGLAKQKLNGPVGQRPGGPAGQRPGGVVVQLFFQ